MLMMITMAAVALPLPPSDPCPPKDCGKYGMKIVLPTY